MNTHQAANVCSRAASEKLKLLEELMARLSVGELDRYRTTIDELQLAVTVLNAAYPQPLGINVNEYITVKDRFG